MLRRCAVLLSIALMCLSLHAGTYVLTKSVYAGHESVDATYRDGRNWRIVHIGATGGPERATIFNFDQKVLYELDFDAREYVERRPERPDWILSLAQWIVRPPRQSGKTVNVYYERTDTGERRQFFGRTAKHILTRERHVAELGACTPTFERVVDGWYIPHLEALHVHTSFTALNSPDSCADTIVKHDDPSPPGFAVMETEGPISREVLKLSSGTLGDKLFQAPPGFKKVNALPGEQQATWFQHLESELAQLANAIESRFE